MEQTVALLLVDIVGSTELTVKLGEAAASDLWSAHDRHSRDLVAACGGVEIDKTDGFLLWFDSADKAAHFADRYHAALRALQPPLRARGALHVAHVWRRATPAADIARGARPFEVDGLAKAVVARAISVACGGQTVLTQTAAEALRSSASRAIGELGHWMMKGFDTPFALYEIIDDTADVEPPLDNAKAHRVARHGDVWLPVREVPHNLPAETSTFVGRRLALLTLRQSQAAGTRLVTLLGPGGVGKTRLAQRAAWSALGVYPGGVWFCDLSAATTLDGVVHAVAAGLRLPPTQTADPAQLIGDAIRGRGACLVVLDNFEQVAAHARATIGRWLTDTIDAQFLVTSRVALKVRGEELHRLDSLSDAEALEMLARLGRSVRGDFTIEAAELGLARRLLDRLDRLPLAIELAASRLSALSLAQMLARMDQRFRLLSSADPQAGRHSALRATLEWSWDLLTATERFALATASVFQAGFTLEAFEAIVASSVTPTDWPIDLLQALVDKSLLRRTAAGRYDMLHGVREFAGEQLCGMPAGEDAAARLRHAEHYAALDPLQARRATEEIENLVAASRWAWAAEHPELLGRLLWLSWVGLQTTGPFRTALGIAEPVLEHDGAEPALRSVASYVAGSACKMMGDAARAEVLLAQAVALAAEQPDLRLRTTALCGWSDCLLDRGDSAAALSHVAGARELADALGDDRLKLLCMNSEAACHHQVGSLLAAQPLYESALALAQRIGDRRWQGGILGNLGNLAQAGGHHERAAALYEQALAMSESEGHLRWAVNTRCNLGLLQCQLGRHDDAERLLAQALTEAEALGSRLAAAIIECNLGIVAAARGRNESARDRFASFRARAGALGQAALTASAGGYLAAAAARLGDMQAALSALLPALDAAGSLAGADAAILAAQHAEVAGLRGSAEAAPLLAGAEEQARHAGCDAAFEVASALASARAAAARAAELTGPATRPC